MSEELHEPSNEERRDLYDWGEPEFYPRAKPDPVDIASEGLTWLTRTNEVITKDLMFRPMEGCIMVAIPQDRETGTVISGFGLVPMCIAAIMEEVHGVDPELFLEFLKMAATKNNPGDWEDGADDEGE